MKNTAESISTPSGKQIRGLRANFNIRFKYFESILKIEFNEQNEHLFSILIYVKNHNESEVEKKCLSVYIAHVKLVKIEN